MNEKTKAKAEVKKYELTKNMNGNIDKIVDAVESSRVHLIDVNGKKVKAFSFEYKKGKDLTTCHVTDSKLVATLSNIDVVAELETTTSVYLVKAFSTITLENAKKLGFKSVLEFIKAVFTSKLDDNTINRYYAIGRIFIDKDTKDFYPLVAGVPISNLDVARRVLKHKENKIDISTLSDKECKKEYGKIADLIASDTLHLSLSQADLKTEVSTINKGIIDNKDDSKDDSKGDNTGDSTDDNKDDNKDDSKDDSNNDNADNSKIDDSNKVASAIDIIRKYLDNDEMIANFNAICAYIATKIS